MRLKEQTPATHNRTRDKGRCQASLSQVRTATTWEKQTCHSDTGTLVKQEHVSAAGEQAHWELEVSRKQLDGASQNYWRRQRHSPLENTRYQFL